MGSVIVGVDFGRGDEHGVEVEVSPDGHVLGVHPLAQVIGLDEYRRRRRKALPSKANALLSQIEAAHAKRIVEMMCDRMYHELFYGTPIVRVTRDE